MLASKTFPQLDQGSMLQLAQLLAEQLQWPMVIFLEGDLGAGKTTFSRGLIQSLGHKGNVKSPTYTLVEPYEDLIAGPVYHFDLYRLADPEELEFMGIRDYLDHAVCLVEWSERGQGILPQADLIIHLTYAENGNSRDLTIEGLSVQGQLIIENWQAI
ncbi:tRNA (adenosine(37)-N6)-threonylcarbamoyltransferase complex ATPase subunit type 1 TsaE [Pelagibaculum spongiae]|uniref:tRNA threonylcarbamoyladenosine biosynthesis protein TsaE n=1 Tax=Pelagibaculum spongiae TaxID=2080658 RepID=A0A2V1H443_9GAMM|nr:tRNA (adenosine(37)-N6)-threonylcarbamoyltransferase complex ATPase subunit type 1 TsaE [Pelagibaculum spongiae]